MGLGRAVSGPDVAAACHLVAATVNRGQVAAVRLADGELPDQAVMPKVVAAAVVQQIRRT